MSTLCLSQRLQQQSEWKNLNCYQAQYHMCGARLHSSDNVAVHLFAQKNRHTHVAHAARTRISQTSYDISRYGHGGREREREREREGRGRNEQETIGKRTT